MDAVRWFRRISLSGLSAADGAFAVDATGKLSGRGAYICRKTDCLKKAVGSKALEKSFKVSIPSEVYEQLDKELRDIEE